MPLTLLSQIVQGGNCSFAEIFVGWSKGERVLDWRGSGSSELGFLFAFKAKLPHFMVTVHFIFRSWLSFPFSERRTLIFSKPNQSSFQVTIRLQSWKSKFEKSKLVSKEILPSTRPRELTGAVDLISHFKLLPHYEFFCKRPLPVSIADTHYLHNVVGDTDIRKGDGMQLDQLIQYTSSFRDTNARMQPFDLDVLKEAFQLRETAPVDLPAHKSSKIDELGAIKVAG
ncbi:hypothetical protein ACSQ67_021347 [Phaseolus vulgaris]